MGRMTDEEEEAELNTGRTMRIPRTSVNTVLLTRPGNVS